MMKRKQIKKWHKKSYKNNIYGFTGKKLTNEYHRYKTAVYLQNNKIFVHGYNY